ncbi:UNVERIFIED_CONTAM: hypothetical protein Slati_3150400, partial [Sesamum latifolium]
QHHLFLLFIDVTPNPRRIPRAHPLESVIFVCLLFAFVALNLPGWSHVPWPGTFTEETTKDEKWLLHVDGSSTTQGSGASIVITSPQGEDLEFAVKFGFKASNNEAEYEALVPGMKMAHEAGARHLLAYSDSQLVVKQVEGTYEAKEKTWYNISNR